MYERRAKESKRWRLEIIRRGDVCVGQGAEHAGRKINTEGH